MPSALETLVKVLKLEQDTGFQDRAVIGGLRSFSSHWAVDAHSQAKKPEHHALVDELAAHMSQYADLAEINDRQSAVKYMLGRITGRIQSSQAQSASEVPPPVTPPAPSVEVSAPTEKPELEAPQQPGPERENQLGNRREKQRNRNDRPRQDAPPEAVAAPSRTEDARPERGEPTENVEPPQSAAEPAANLPRFGAGERPKAMDAAPALNVPRRRRRQSREYDAEAMRKLRAPITELHGVGPKISEKLQQLGLKTIGDWLYFFPRRYDDFTRMMPLNKISPGMVVTVVGMIRNSVVIKGRRGQEILQVTVDDGTGTLAASFFGQPYLKSKMERGQQIVLSGKVGSYQSRITMDNPEWEFLEADALHTRGIVPVYPLTKGLSAHAMRRLSSKVIDLWANEVPDYMPETVLDRMNLPELSWALQQMHFPDSQSALDLAKKRLAFDDLLTLQLGVLRNRREWQSQPAEPLPVSDEWLSAALGGLPYTLTGAQLRAIEAIRADLAESVPMNRLLQGDVGAGKTVVAAIAMYIAIANGAQAAIMAPTSILAEQHYKGISRLLSGLPGGGGVHVRLLTSATPSAERAEILEALANGNIHLLIGTHSLIQGDVNFARLGLAVIDEQHRFGVEQRGALRGKGTNPHVLVMTATPIPRTLALTMYADLDLTVLDEMPPGRTPIQTMVIEPRYRERAYSFINAHLDRERQAFIVYPLVEASESDTMSEVKSAVEEYERLQKDIFPNRRLGLLHGRLSQAQKDSVMGAFSRGELDVLVSTSVVEVGIDVPNANVILIEGANRFGLAQLHQFRGRVGRGEHASFCLLVPDDSDLENPRLLAMAETTDGFKLAEMDWQQRGAGELLGTRQSGGSPELFGSMDIRLVESAQLEAKTLFEEDPTLSQSEHQGLRAHVDTRFAPSENADMS